MFSRTVPRNTHVSCSTMENWSCTFQRGTDLVLSLIHILPYYAVRDIRHGVRCPGNDVNRFMCVPGQILLSRFSISPLFEQPGQKHPRKIANSALPHNIRHHTSAEFRASGFAYIERCLLYTSHSPGESHPNVRRTSWPLGTPTYVPLHILPPERYQASACYARRVIA